MQYLIFVAITAATWFIGTFGLCQIIGSIQYAKVRAVSLTIFTITLWTIILGAVAAVVLIFFAKYKLALLIGYAISLLMSLSSGRME